MRASSAASGTGGAGGVEPASGEGDGVIGMGPSYIPRPDSGGNVHFNVAFRPPTVVDIPGPRVRADVPAISTWALPPHDTPPR
ncbi:hypothetical protein GCM10010299_26070 [Streptomyces tanashiensis]|nr:hypothetical protein GCM10010299_26070 [Streptomyces tanashiensis]